MKRQAVLILALILGIAPGVWAQASGGNIYGTVNDASGAVMPGAAVTLTGTLGARSSTTGAQGEVRFLNLDPGTYKMTVSLQGFATVTRDVVVTTGGNVNVAFSMKVATQEETVTVTAETPVIDTKKVGTATTMSKEELAQVPQSRDPWAVLKTVPGVIVDRVNVAGNESGQQSGFVGKGAQPGDTMWNLDGVVITDTTSGGASSNYFDFDAFDEINVSTGGGDLKVQTGGLGINFVTKRGTNAFHGSVRGFLSHDKLQSNNLPDELVGDPRLGDSDAAQHTDQISDWGADLGGPIVKDKLWFWGSYGKQDIRIVRLNQTKDKTLLKNWNAKMNWQASSNDMISFFFFNGAKEKFGRDPGQAGTTADSFLWNQGNFYPEENCPGPIPCGAHGIFKLEANHTFSPNFFMNAKYAYFGWGYGFSRGGADKEGGIDSDNDIAYGSWFGFTARKPWQIVDVNGNYFKAGMGGNHEFKFGFGYRRNPDKTSTTWSGSQNVAWRRSADESFVWVTRQRNVEFIGESTNAYIGDTFTRGKLSINAGVRWDRQQSKNLASTAQANPTFPEILPTLSYDGSGQDINWKSFSPRVSATLALDESRKTVLRASYANYAGQLNPFEVTSASPVGGYYTYLAYKWVDLNNDHFAQKNEILTGEGVQYSNNVDPNNPTSASSPNQIDPNYKANRDHEFIVGIDRELAPNFGVGAAYTWRKSYDLTGWNPRIGLTSADYSLTTSSTARGFSASAFGPNDAALDASGGGRILTNRPDFTNVYSGIELTAVKRLSNKWMFRAAFSYMDWTEHYNGPGAVQNPTRSDTTNGGTLSGPQVDGGQVAPRSGGSGKGDIFYNAKWQFSANALYQLPAGFEVATSIFGRQGFTRPIILTLSGGGDGSIRTVATPNIDDTRYPNLWDADLRLARNTKLGGATLNISLDLFNVFNSNTILAQARQANAGAFGNINEILSPRILRVGVRLLF